VRKLFGVSLVVALVLSFSLVVTTTVSASPADWYVDAVNGDDGNDGLSWATAFATIVKAMDEASGGDTIMVAAGTYAENITVDKSLELLGPNQGKPGCADDRVSEAVLEGPEIRITAANVIIDGFRMAGPSTSGNALRAQAGANGLTIRHNIIEVGMYVVAVIDDFTYSYNLARDLLLCSPPTATNVIYATSSGGENWAITNNKMVEIRNGIVLEIPGQFRNLTFSENEVLEFTHCGVNIGQGTTVGDLTITDNTFWTPKTGALGVFFWYTGAGVAVDPDAVITITGNDIVAPYGLFLAASAVGSGATVDVAHNKIRENDVAVWVYTAEMAGIINRISYNFIGFNTWGILIEDGADPSGISVDHNAICCNTIGVDNRDSEPFDATNNWWGSNDGPGGDGPGKGDVVTGNVIYDPWLVLTLTADPPSVAPGGTSVITADATMNSDGVDTGASIPDGTPILFATTSGSVDPELAIAQDGVAVTTYTAGTEPGIVSATAPCYPENIEVLDIPLAPVPSFTVGWEGSPVDRLKVMAPWLVLLAGIIAGASVLLMRRRGVRV